MNTVTRTPKLCTQDQTNDYLSARLEQQRRLIEHNERMLKLRVNGQAYRDRLVRERLKLRSDRPND